VALPKLASLAGLRVLVVDDDEDCRELVGAVLGEAGAEVRLASSSQETLALIRGFAPHVFVSDIAMPGGDGYDLVQRLRRELAADELPATLALSAHARAEDRQAAVEAGYKRHLAKPVQPEELVEAVARLGTGRRLAGATTAHEEQAAGEGEGEQERADHVAGR
jgi:CheY-like chemotaxis protein